MLNMADDVDDPDFTEVVETPDEIEDDDDDDDEIVDDDEVDDETVK